MLRIPVGSPHVPQQGEPSGGPGEERWAGAGAPRSGRGEGAHRRGAKEQEVRGAGRNGVGRDRGPAASCSGPARGGREARPCPALGQRPAVPAGIALIMWNALYTAEKAIIRWSLLAEACYFAVQFLGE